MADGTLVIGTRRYSSWSLRGWLMLKFSGLEFEEEVIPPSNPNMRAELLLLSPSMLVPALKHDGLAPGRSRAAGALPLDLRRDAFRVRSAALRAADEPQR